MEKTLIHLILSSTKSKEDDTIELIWDKISLGWVAHRNGICGQGDTVKEAVDDLKFIEELYNIFYGE